MNKMKLNTQILWGKNTEIFQKQKVKGLERGKQDACKSAITAEKSKYSMSGLLADKLMKFVWQISRAMCDEQHTTTIAI